MSIANNNPAVRSLYGTAVSIYNNKKVRFIVQLLFVIGMGVATAYGKKLHPSMGIPGSSAVWWLAPMMAGKIAVRRDGSGVLMGATVALCTIPIGLEHTTVYNLGLYGATGLVLDMFPHIPRANIRNPFGAITCGILAHMVKYGFILSAALTSSVTKHFLVVGILESAGLHFAFGAAAGLIGWIPYAIWKLKQKAGK
jgi:hypothetical protein